MKGGETLALIGESGSGKSTLGLATLRLRRPTSGRIEFMGIDVTKAEKYKPRPLRRYMQVLLQDPYSSQDEDGRRGGRAVGGGRGE
ncbi:hypothetical protein HS1genome_1550 [Sulfodiicoccus acidiphilus]|uniref:ABC transporter domain-containing protein n=1 Tax=Sulfodiicoccus acidiphilus TaxID=1670455 RepID=A0A348B4Q9_9CREN|nr:ATP-binding cassette domain-containing protein [Sulfodiicoccus acidiphilus]BBD73161.1 hypothetical protein HS1genome_1550 [Sulfodiicoccus acidiphilus]GGU01229.1 hypothetical protein GCM10007116_17980 [Sulfodiicoccus acidiphilus]